MIEKHFPFTAEIKKLSETDSLKQSIVYLNSRLDSLSKHTQINEIGQNFFSDAISRDLYMFSTIVVIAGLVSWASIAGMLTLHKHKVDKATRLEIAKLSNTVDERINSITDSLKETVYNVNRSMYFTFVEGEDPHGSFTWAMSSAAALFDFQGYDDLPTLQIWLGIIIKDLQSIDVGSITDNDVVFTDSLPILEKVDNEEIQEMVKKIKKEMLHLIYSKPQPPDDLMEDAQVID
jgi:hypothetical protein